MHAHEVLFALGLYALIGNVISPLLSPRLFPRAYPQLSRGTKIGWHVHVVSILQSLVVNTPSLYVIFSEDERQVWTREENWRMRVWGYSGLTGLLQSMALGVAPSARIPREGVVPVHPHGRRDMAEQVEKRPQGPAEDDIQGRPSPEP